MMFSPNACLSKRMTRRDDLHLPRGHVLRVDDALDAAEVVDVGVGVDHGLDRLVADVLADDLHALPRRLDTGHRVDDDQTRLALDNGEVGDLGVADLVDPGDHLEQTGLRQHLGLAPQTRIHRVGARGVVGEECVRRFVVEGRAGVGLGSTARDRGEVASFGVEEVLTVLQVVA